MEENNYKVGLYSFIMSMIGINVLMIPFIGTIACLVLSIISLVKLSDEGEITKQPYRTFSKIAKPVSIVGICLAPIVFIFYLFCIGAPFFYGN